MQEAEAAADEYTTAKKYYLLAKDVYASVKMDDKVEEIARKMERLDIRNGEKEAETPAESVPSQGAPAESPPPDNSSEAAEEPGTGMVLE